MSYTTERYKFETGQTKGLLIDLCGWQKCNANHQALPWLYKLYSLTFILEGRGQYTVNHETFSLEKGQGFMIVPGASPSYKADADEPWEYIFVCFSGIDAEAIIEAMGMNGKNLTFTYPKSDEFLKILYSMLSASKSRRVYEALGYFMLAVSQVIYANGSYTDSGTHQEQYVQKAIAYMQKNFTNVISISKVALQVGIERSYLYRLFVKQMGQSPAQWLMDYRLEQGQKLLISTGLTITDVAQYSGFFDAAHFTHAFRKKYGCTPKQYRERSEPRGC